MRRLLPSKTETAIFAALAIICAVIVSMGGAPDVRLALLSMPVFLAAALMGLRRNQRLVRIALRARERRRRDS
jgi:hypothetical protein